MTTTTSARVAFLPTPPILIPELATGAAAELDVLRDCAWRAVDWACTGAQSVGVLVPTPQPQGATLAPLQGFGRTLGDGPDVSVDVGLAHWYLQGRSATLVNPGQPLRAFDAVLVMGDASASRTDKAPGHFDERAVPFDDAVTAALEAGDTETLAELDLDLAAAVGAFGAPAWAALGSAVETVSDPHLVCADDPYGVLYVVATWNVRWADPA